MFKILRATIKDAQLLSKLSVDTFLPAHGHSAPKIDIDNYVTQNFNTENFITELSDINNCYYLLYSNDQIAGYSKIVFNHFNENIPAKNTAYMSRLYLLERFYGSGLGKKLFDFNLHLCKEHQQSGIWLAVWVENQKAISFYKKMGFLKVGDYDFKISERHKNPNHILYLEF
ncbi:MULTISPECIES: GNAT family N-acetyltransferase [unclassified Polaribacter]|uniref:GNAT family N-acetyltransferase n=1 Tax=unclassified Polaribacter TaxID=196858 RepID=UPI0011BE8451|nr:MULTISPECIES: GNAT family N-acetyltransferase [unclassified Polaribacter]TXD54442.1 GNAT family N-acetyltransferase [Polaribacter sp. IC063]TXD60355.1 GNAT family N-acetyltransferase [Polaribacter sp. IC066]